MGNYMIFKRISDDLDVTQLRQLLLSNKLAGDEIIVTIGEYQDLRDKTNERLDNHKIMLSKGW